MKIKRLLSILMVLSLFITSIGMPGIVQASQAPDDVINIPSESDWQGSIFYDVGGNDKITATNFEITENEDKTVKVKASNQRGKISGSSEGMAYYFKEVPEDANFELTATAHIDSFITDGDSNNKQVAFGLMLRGDVLLNESKTASEYGKSSSYVAVGGVDLGIKGFYRNLNTNSKSTVDYTEAIAPATGQTYELSIKKMGNIFELRVGDQTQIIDKYTGPVKYAGLFTARNAAVTYSNINLKIEGQIDLGDWVDSFFGDSVDEAFTNFTLNEDGTFTISVTGDKGKIASKLEGISYHYKELPSSELNFEIKTKAKVDAWTANSQVAFGLMLRSNILDNKSLSGFTGDYVALGAIDQKIKGFYKYAGQDVEKSNFEFTNAIAPSVGKEYELSIKKSGNLYVLKVGDETQVIEEYTGAINYAGLFVSRNATVTFSDFEIKVDTRKLSKLEADTTGMKKQYLLGENLDLTGLAVTAVYDNGSTETLTGDDVIVTGFNNTVVGTNTITINYNGVTTTTDIEIVPLTVTNMEIKYYPAKMNYYKLDTFDPLGLTVVATYNNGYSIQELTEEQYTIFIQGQSTTESPFEFTNVGEHLVDIQSNETTSAAISFNVNVIDADITNLEIKQLPEKTQYFIGDDLDLDGIVVYANYSDNSKVRLMRNEFVVSGFDSLTSGNKELTVTYKGQSVNFIVNVKVKDTQGLKVTKYPKTTYYINEEFNSNGLEVSKVYDNGDLETVTYDIDLSNYNNTVAGVYEIIINAEGLTTVLPVTVREKVEHQWKQIIFGQSSGSKNTITQKENGVVELVALDGGGKITGDHDGISFYYVELDALEDNFTLSADIKVLAYAKTPHDGQESFGIMARDAIGTHLNSSVFASNIAAIGGFSGGTQNPNGTQLFVRTGVESPDGAGSLGIQAKMIENLRPTSTSHTNYKLTLAKTNSGFTGKLNNGAESIIFEPEILTVQNNKMYVGFYTARLATIEVKNIDLQVTAAATDAPRVAPPKQPVEPNVWFESLDKVSLANYNVMFKSNINGVATIKQGQNVIASDIEVIAGKLTTIPTTIAKNVKTNLSLTFIPDDTQYLTTYEQIVKNFTVDMRTYQEDNNIYVSPNGSSNGTGTKENPLNLDTAIDFVMPGQTIILLDGTYNRTSSLVIRKYNDGTADAMKKLYAEEGTRPVINFGQRSEGVVHSGNYWHIKGIDITRSAGNTKGYTVGGSNNIIELVNLYENGDTGLQISRTDVTEEDKTKWPSNNLILNATSYRNSDPSQNNADGFAAKLTSGYGNVFDGCIAYNNIDDGWDLYTKVGTGAIGAVILRNCIAYDNGFVPGISGTGDGNGFKLGGEGVHVPHVIENSMAFGNLADGYTSNSNPGVIARGQNIAINNKVNLSFSTYTGITPDFTVEGFISYHYNNPSASKDVATAVAASDNNFLYNGSKSVNASGFELTNNNFSTLVMPKTINRNADGTIDWSFLTYDPAGSQSPEEPEQPTEPETPEEPEQPTDSNKDTSSTTPIVVENKDGSVTIKSNVVINQSIAEAIIDKRAFNSLITKAKVDSSGTKKIVIEVNKVSGVNGYVQSLPASALATKDTKHTVTVATEVGTIELTNDTLSNYNLTETDVVKLNILNTNANTDNKAIEVYFTVNGNKVKWENKQSPVKVSIPYTPAKGENTEHLVVIYIDEAGNRTTVSNGRYNVEKGVMEFTTNHFSKYAIAYVQETFNDLAGYDWAKKSIEVLASKGIIKGTSTIEKTFSPGANISRADFIVLLVNTLGLTRDVTDNFSDVNAKDYFYNAVGIAKELGIASGVGSNKFNPSEKISRQDMMALTARAMVIAGVTSEKADISILDKFTDKANIAPYAVESMARLVNDGLIVGYDNTLNPQGNATRAETATFMYKLYNLR